jgi:hypothetical protein
MAAQGSCRLPADAVPGHAATARPAVSSPAQLCQAARARPAGDPPAPPGAGGSGGSGCAPSQKGAPSGLRRRYGCPGERTGQEDAAGPITTSRAERGGGAWPCPTLRRATLSGWRPRGAGPSAWRPATLQPGATAAPPGCRRGGGAAKAGRHRRCSAASWRAVLGAPAAGRDQLTRLPAAAAVRWRPAYEDLRHACELEAGQGGGDVSSLVLNNLGNAEAALGMWDDAMGHYRRGSAARPALPCSLGLPSPLAPPPSPLPFFSPPPPPGQCCAAPPVWRPRAAAHAAVRRARAGVLRRTCSCRRSPRPTTRWRRSRCAASAGGAWWAGGGGGAPLLMFRRLQPPLTCVPQAPAQACGGIGVGRRVQACRPQQADELPPARPPPARPRRWGGRRRRCARRGRWCAGTRTSWTCALRWRPSCGPPAARRRPRASGRRCSRRRVRCALQCGQRACGRPAPAGGPRALPPSQAAAGRTAGR